MNKRQKLVQQQFLNNEKGVIKRLNQVYSQSLKDVTAKSQKLYDEIEELTSVYDDVEDEAEKAVLKSRIQSKVYQKQYQDGLKKQLDGILDKLKEEQFVTVSDYLNKCYEEGFVGTLYDLQGQGIPLAFPLDQEAMVRAVQIDSKISNGLYNHLGENVDMLKKHITAQVSRGISSGMTFNQIAKQLSMKMMGTYTNPKGSLAYAKRIARTEGHRIQCQSTMDACHNAKDRGADVVKQWDSTLDAKTRDSHAMVDGEYKELDEKFSNGLMFPGDPSGGAAEVVNCRCALLQRARWAVEGGFTKMNNFTKQLETFDSPEGYNEFKKGFFSKENRQYMNYVQDMENKYKTKDFAKILDKMDDREYNHYSKLLESNPIFKKKVTKLAKVAKVEDVPNATPKTSTFVPAKTIEEAKATLKDKFGLDASYDYKGIDLDTANMINKEISAVYEKFGNLHEMGVLDTLFISSGKTEYYAAYQHASKTMILNKSTVSKKNAMAKMKKEAKECYKMGFWSTNEAEHSIRHELGHAVDYAYIRTNALTTKREQADAIAMLSLDIENKCGIKRWSLADSEEHMKAAGKELSYYALMSEKEFVAESIAEYMGGNPRETANKVVDIILKGV